MNDLDPSIGIVIGALGSLFVWAIALIAIRFAVGF